VSHLPQQPVAPRRAGVEESVEISPWPVGDLSVAELEERLTSLQSERQVRIRARLPSTKHALLERELISELRRRGVVHPPP
jgi:hypothetical protein